MKKQSFLHALATLVYITFVSTLMQNGERLLGKTDNFFSPIIFLLLFTLSAIIVSALIVGKPIMLYLDGKKKEAVGFFLHTVGWMAGFTVVVLVVAALIFG